MRVINIFTILVFINLGDTLFSGSVGRFSRNTRNNLNKLVLEFSIPKEKNEKASDTPEEPKKSLTDEYFDRALEEAEKQTNAVE